MRTDISPELLFKGRPGDPRLGELVQCVSTLPKSSSGIENVILVGCPDDTGVVSNRGRAGAKLGPDSVRKHLYKMTPPMQLKWGEKFNLYDFGNAVVSPDILTTHKNAFANAKAVSESGSTLITIGGGHDFAAPNFLGFKAGLPSKTKLGLINIDPHLDVRPLEKERPHSGTPFRQIIDSKQIEGKNVIQFGTRPNRNAIDHFQYCKKNRVSIFTLESLLCSTKGLPDHFKTHLNRLSTATKTVCLTIDMDVCSDAEGTSAAPVIGISARELYQIAYFAGMHPKVRFLEIAEVAPSLDPTERSSRIASEIIYAFLLGRLESKTRKR